MAVELSFWQKIESIIFPVSVRKSSNALNPVLELFYYRRRYILATKDAVYSDGTEYRPLVKAFDAPVLKPHLGQLKNVLVLGTGLASAVHILYARHHRPHMTLVEIDAAVLEWAREFLPAEARAHVRAEHADAFAFIAADANTYDLIIVDIFIGRTVPEKATDPIFLEQCKARLNSEGFLILNYMEARADKPGKAKAALEAAFDTVTEISFGINKVYIAQP
jgi:spermidine synthase